MIKPQALLLLIAGLIALRESIQERARVSFSSTISTAWHLCGWLIRFFVFALLFLVNSPIWLLVVSVVLMWPVYNIGCNIGAKKKWYYLSDKGIDGFLKKLFKLK